MGHLHQIKISLRPSYHEYSLTTQYDHCRRVQNLKLSFEALVPAQVKCRSNAVGNHKFHPESQTQLCLAADIDNLLGAIIFCNFFGFNPLNTILATFLFQHVLKLIRRSSYFISAVCHDLPISIFLSATLSLLSRAPCN